MGFDGVGVTNGKAMSTFYGLKKNKLSVCLLVYSVVICGVRFVFCVIVLSFLQFLLIDRVLWHVVCGWTQGTVLDSDQQTRRNYCHGPQSGAELCRAQPRRHRVFIFVPNGGKIRKCCHRQHVSV